jgi:hypothetical protein
MAMSPSERLAGFLPAVGACLLRFTVEDNFGVMGETVPRLNRVESDI